MKHSSKSQAQLIAELESATKKITELEKSEDHSSQTDAALKESEKKYRTYIENAPEGIFIINNKREYIDVNEPALVLTGYSKEELLKMTTSDLLAPESSDTSKSFAMLQQSGSIEIEIPLRKKDGSDIFVSLKAVTLSEDSFMAFCSDITDRKIAEEALQEKTSEANLLKEMLDNSSQPFAVGTLDGRLMRVNPAFCSLTGYSNDELLNNVTWNETLTPLEWRDFENEKVQNLINTGKPQYFEKEYIHKDGKRIPVELLINIKIDSKGNIENVFGFITDITQRKLSEELLKNSENQWRSTFCAISDIVLILSPDHEILDINDAGIEYLNLDKGDIVGNKCYGLVHGTDEPIKECPCVKSMKSKESFENEYMENGRFYLLSCWPVFDDSNEIISLTHIVKDITVEKLSEVSLINSEKELKELNATKDKFFSIIAHDLKSPISGLIGLTDTLVKDFANITITELKTISQAVNESSENVYNLLENLLEWSKMQSNSKSFKPEMLILGDLIETNQILYSNLLKQKSITRIDNCTEDCRVLADKGMISSVLRNLLTNAIKFTHEGGVITVETKEFDKNYYVYSIQDNGLGMDEDTLDKLFKIDKKESRLGTLGEKGTGLGLILCKEFTEKQGGKIWVKSQPGKGSTFFFTLPKAD